MRQVVVFLAVMALLGLLMAGCGEKQEDPVKVEVTPGTTAPVGASPKHQLPPPPKKEGASPAPEKVKK